MAVDGEETDQLALSRRAGVDRRVHDRVVEMLALYRRMIADDHIAFMQPHRAINLEPIACTPAPTASATKIGLAAIALRDQPAIGIRHADRIVLVFINIRTERRAGHIRVDLIVDRDNAVADDFESDRIDGLLLGHVAYSAASLWQRMRISRNSPISNVSPGHTTVVAPYSSITAGPVPMKPGARS